MNKADVVHRFSVYAALDDPHTAEATKGVGDPARKLPFVLPKVELYRTNARMTGEPVGAILGVLLG